MTISHPLQEKGEVGRVSEPCVLVIFGATGDLTAKKLLPALYNLMRDGQLPSHFACVGFARRTKTHEQFREEARSAIDTYSRNKPIDANLYSAFKEQIFYHTSEFHDESGYESLKQFLQDLDAKFGTKGNRIFYLATAASFFSTICEKLHKVGLIYQQDRVTDKWSRIIIEKPFGHDLDSAKALQKELLQFLREEQIYRIDHYLGKETVQNILIFRFANSIFESLWNNRYIDHVQITVAEDIGIGTRGRLWEESGYLRDIIQNHMMQLLTLMAMEPPVSLAARSIHDEKVKVLRAIRAISPERDTVRGQYGKGFVNAKEVVGYREEKDVDPHSNIETYVALRLFIDNWRWEGVPFYLRGGKRLPKKATEIAVAFKDPPSVLFQQNNKQHQSNVLAIRIQPDEGISLKINSKIPGPSSPIQPVKMDFRYGSYFGMAPPEAYERLICDAILGDSTLFAREDEVFHSWALLTPILEHWQKWIDKDYPNYEAGSWGPQAADDLMAQDRRKWRLI